MCSWGLFKESRSRGERGKKNKIMSLNMFMCCIWIHSRNSLCDI